MTIIFDEGYDTERSLILGLINEQPFQHSLMGSHSMTIGDEGFPVISGFDSGSSFSTVKVVDGTMVVPLLGVYNRITSFSTSYRDSNKSFQINITLGYEEDKE